MISTLARVQLAAFALIALAALTYGAFRFAGVDALIRPPYTVHAQFTQFGGIYPQADVNLLGTRVGSVTALRPGPGTGTTADLAIDHGVRIPRDVTATIMNKSAIGEQYVELEPNTAGEPLLREDSVITTAHTRTPPAVQDLLGNLNALAASVPKKDLTTNLSELSTAVGDLGPALQRLLDDTDALTDTGLRNLTDLTDLIDNAATVLDTQVAAAPRITTFSEQLATLTDRLRQLDPTFERVFSGGIRAGTEVTSLLADNQRALPHLLTNLLSITDVAADRLPALRKTLVVYPWALQQAATAFRYCDEYDPQTGKPVPQTCHYDPDTGKPIWSAHLAMQLPELPGRPPYFPCIKGYEGTKRYLPNGAPADGVGPPEQPDSPSNQQARCTAAPTDPSTPNVRGAQNAQRPTDRSSTQPGTGLAVYNPNSGIMASSDGRAYQLSGSSGPAPPDGGRALGWLLTQSLSNPPPPSTGGQPR